MTEQQILRLMRPNIQALEPYSTARDELSGSPDVFLDANESPFENGYNRYPDPRQKDLKAHLAEIKGIPAGNIFIGNGSDEAIDLMYRLFCIPGKDNAVMIAPSYGMYGVAARTNDVEARQVVLNDDFSLPSERILAACDGNTKLIWICSPNNPTGNAFPREQILHLAEKTGCMVVVDEAYIDFSSQPSLLGDIAANPNIVVLQTLSKAWGMAGLRLGMAFGAGVVISKMNDVKYPYNINGPVQKVVLGQLQNPVDDKVALTLSERDRLRRGLEETGFRVHPSDANFLLVDVAPEGAAGRDEYADKAYKYLLDKGIIVRNRTRMPLCGGCIRITVGLPEENSAVLEAMARFRSVPATKQA